jgi:hypothetical protein
MTMPRGGGEGEAGGEARNRNRRWRQRAGGQGGRGNAGHQAKAPMNRGRWGNRDGSVGGSMMLARTFARLFPGG